MRKLLLALLVLLSAGGARAADPGPVPPYECDPAAVPATPLDAFVLSALRERGIEPANPCSDAVFLRRAYLDVIGTMPEASETRAFLEDRRPGKRAALVDRLLERPEFADYWALKWSDLLRVKSEFPINLWPNAVQAYHRWIRDSLRAHVSYDRFALDLLTSSGSNFRVPPVNFYRAVPGRDPASIAGAVALTFMGTRTADWPEPRRRGMEAFFSRIAIKTTQEWKEEIVLADPAPDTPLEAVLPDGVPVLVAPGDDPRRAFAEWLVAPENPWFARAVVNRIWSWLLGRGIVHEPDDLRPGNPPSNPGLLAYLERELLLSGYDLRHVFRLVLNSRTWQQSPVPRSAHPHAAALFAWYPVRRLDAEVVADALCWIGGEGERYTSIIPEPFTFVPESRRSIELADGSITSRFLEMFGRPARDTGLESERRNQPTDAQRLHMLNATDVQRRIERSPRLRAAYAAAKGDLAELVRSTYLTLLSRPPEAAEAAAALRHVSSRGRSVKQGADDLAWALVNSKEFLFRH